MSDPFTSTGRRSETGAPLKLGDDKRLDQDVPASPRREPRASVPSDFVYETEHPVLPIPFTATVGGTKLDGTGISVAAAYVAIKGVLDPAWKDHREVVTLQFDFDGFSITLFPEIVVPGARRDGEMTLQFMDPAGAHLPQLRYIINSYLAGDFVTMNGLLSYTGPVKPKSGKGSEASPSRLRIRSIAVGFLSLSLIFATVSFLFNRATQTIEPRPVFIERIGQDMRATSAGQVSYLNPNATAGEVVFSINSNSGDVLNFQLPCDCEVEVTEGIFEGATVLPIDVILSLFDSNAGVRVQTQMSIEGLGKAMNGERTYLDISDGRTIPVEVRVTTATYAAAERGDLFVPVSLVHQESDLSVEDIGKSAQLRLIRPLISGSFLVRNEES
jgi:alginate biosynthesis protein Alg44